MELTIRIAADKEAEVVAALEEIAVRPNGVTDKAFVEAAILGELQRKVTAGKRKIAEKAAPGVDPTTIQVTAK